MAHDQRIPVDAAYAQILGYAVYNFTYLEWIVIWTVEKLAKGMLNIQKKMSAGQIASEFEKALSRPNNLAKELNDELAKAAQTFRALIKRRNDLLHAHPYTAPDKAQRLRRTGTDWKIEDLEAFATDIQSASRHLNHIFHDHLNHLS